MITTKKGDNGETSCGNIRVSKDSLLVDTIGEIDELQSILELVGVEEKIINDLSGIMGELGCEVKFEKYNLRIEEMEQETEKMPKIIEFLKFKNKKALEFNWTRTVCRRVERRVVSLAKKQKVNESILKYFNRLSDYLFFKAVEAN